MKTQRVLEVAGLLLVGCLSSSIVSAAHECSGHYVGVGTKSITISNDPGSPSHVMVGECQGGVCIRKDRDGDEQTVHSAYKDGDAFATWKRVSGTGKYANGKASGWSRQTRAVGDVVVGDWGGTCE